MCLGIPGRIVALNRYEPQLAKVDVAGIQRMINIALLGEEQIEAGDWVLIHVGFAMSKIDEIEAQESLLALQEMGTAYNDELVMLHQSQIE